MAVLRYNKVIKYKAEITCDSPLHIGGSEGEKEEILVHPVTNLPFVQASSLAGMFRSAYEKNHKAEEISNLFGSAQQGEGMSCLKFSDGLFDAEDIKIELRPHVKLNRKTGTVANAGGSKSGQKFDMEYLAEGQTFLFDLYVFVQDEDVDGRDAAIKELLARLKSGDMMLGGKKSNGVGKIHLSDLLRKEFDLCNEAQRRLWINEEELTKDDYEVYIDQLPEIEQQAFAYRIEVKAETEGALQVKGIAMNDFGAGVTDSENMKNAKKEYIIPGSSFKGAIRSQMEKIAGYLSKESIIEEAFGKGGESQKEGRRGNLIFADTVIGDSISNDQNVLRHRIRIDKFTGGVFQQGLFSEKNAVGNLDFHIDIVNRNNPDATLGLLLFVLRDLATQTMTLGNGYATGKGFIKVNQIRVLAGKAEKSADITAKDGVLKLEDPQQIIAQAMASLKEVSA